MANKRIRGELIHEALRSWRSLNEVVNDMSELELKAALERELGHDARTTIVTRLHQRLSKLRSRRERKEYL